MMRKTCLPLLMARILYQERCRKRASGANFDRIEFRMIQEIDILKSEAVALGHAYGYKTSHFAYDAENVQGIFCPKRPFCGSNAQNF